MGGSKVLFLWEIDLKNTVHLSRCTLKVASDSRRIKLVGIAYPFNRVDILLHEDNGSLRDCYYAGLASHPAIDLRSAGERVPLVIMDLKVN
jgi:hypothetical protein